MVENENMEVRCFKDTDTPLLIELFRTTIHIVCSKDYSQDQLDTWAPEQIDVDKWTTRFSRSFTMVAEKNQQIAGFANLESDGCIDMFYVSAEFQSQGVGSRLFEALETEAKKRGLKKLHSDVSITARGFFISKGFIVEKEYSKRVGAVHFPNTIMTKTLT